MELSKDQEKALKALTEWYKNDPLKYITLGGYAGTGKTTLLAHLRQELDAVNNKLSVAFCSFTGKATQVLRRKLNESQAVFKNDTVSTIHSLIYKAVADANGAILGWELRERSEVDADLIVVDEASMVDEKIWFDLQSFGVPIIAVGDHGQLPPVSGSFNLMQNPQHRLEEIHRQARENPIIQLSILAREEGNIPFGKFSKDVCKLNFDESSSEIEEVFTSYNTDTMILCGYNSSRVKINGSVRNGLGIETAEPRKNDRLICLRNNREKGIYNGMLGTLERLSQKGLDKYHVEIFMDDDEEHLFTGDISVEQFNSNKTLNNINGATRTKKLDLFDFGYALTVHKAQGSQSPRVVLFEERFGNMDEGVWRKWLYTAVTRAESGLLVFGR